MYKKTVLIFGGNGAFRSKISQKLLQQNYCVVSIDKNIKNFKKIKKDSLLRKS